jgi:hypothetical protein
MRLPACIALLAPAASHASQPDRQFEPLRFRASATFEATPPAVTDARFRLQGSLAPRQPQVAMDAVGFALKATLQPKGGDPICFGPGHVFANGFENR